LYAAKPAHFVEGGINEWRAGSIRFLEKGIYLYAIELGNEWPTTFGFSDYPESTAPTAPYTIPGVRPITNSEIKMLGSDQALPWRQEGNDLVIEAFPNPLPVEHAWSFQIPIKSN
ncbi:MAG: hypothetical protein AAFP70_20700, partial [Calditrichota bacterium]